MPMTVQAAVYRGGGPTLSIETLSLDDPQDDEVLIKVLAAGLCHSDLHIIDGHHAHQPVPAVLGHESMGIVMKAGAAVTELAAGDRVIPFLLPECGQCANCRSGKTNICLRMGEVVRSGFTRFSQGGARVHAFAGLGCFSDHIVVKAERVAKVSEDADPAAACYASCGGATGVGAARHSGVDPLSSVVVFGLGGIGLNVVQGARMAGAPVIIGIDINPAREEVSRKVGATHFLNPNTCEELVNEVLALTGGGATHSFECVGNVQLMRQAIAVTNPAFGKCTIIGLAPTGAELSVDVTSMTLGRTMGGLLMGGIKPKSMLPDLVVDCTNGAIDLQSLITHRMPLAQINEGFDLMRRGESIRSIIEFD